MTSGGQNWPHVAGKFLLKTSRLYFHILKILWLNFNGYRGETASFTEASLWFGHAIWWLIGRVRFKQYQTTWSLYYYNTHHLYCYSQPSSRRPVHLLETLLTDYYWYKAHPRIWIAGRVKKPPQKWVQVFQKKVTFYRAEYSILSTEYCVLELCALLKIRLFLHVNCQSTTVKWEMLIRRLLGWQLAVQI